MPRVRREDLPRFRPQHVELILQLARHLGDRAAGVFAGAVMHTPVAVTVDAMEIVKDTGAEASCR